MSVRIFMLRALIGWWCIPAFFAVAFPMIWLITSDINEAIDENRLFVNFLWHGKS